MRGRRSLLAVMAVLACSGAAFPNGARAEVVTLEALEKKALEKSALLKAGSARERAASAEVRQAESAYRPRIGLNLDSNLAPGRKLWNVPVGRLQVQQDQDGDGRDEVTSEDTALVQGVNALGQGAADVIVPQWRTLAQLSFGATLYDFGRTHAAITASRAKLNAAETDAELTRTQVVANVRAAYLGWLSAHEQQRLATTASTDAAGRSQRVAALVQEGARPRGDLAPVEAERLLSELERERGSGQLEGALLLLGALVGEPLPADAEPDLHVLEVQPAPRASDKVDPSLRMLAFQRTALEATARAQRKQRAPVLSASAGAGAIAQVDFLDGNSTRLLPSYTVGLGLVVPLWDGGSSEAAAQAAEARADELRIRLESAEREREQELARARLDAEHAARRQATAQQLLEIAKTRVADVEAGYDMGAMQFEQVQAARTMLRRAETEVVMAKVARAEAVLRVLPVAE